MRRPSARVWLPFAILAVGLVGVALLVATRPEVAVQEAPEVAPLVRVVEVQPSTWRYVVHSQGTVEPRTESELVPQVSGEIEWVSPALVSGGFFERDEPLVRIEGSDYRVELESARAALARARSELERARTELERQRTLKEKGVASQARIDDVENSARVAEAAMREARARLERAERDLTRTELRAPFEGRVRDERVDVGQFVNRGNPIATLYAVDAAEVSLPVPDRELRFVDVPLDGLRVPSDAAAPSGPRVDLHAEFAGREHTWHGHVVRTEGEIDAKTRMVNVVARVIDPYGLHAEGDGDAPLAVGLFVRAEIHGRSAEGVYVLPRAALHEGNPMDPKAPDEVHVVDAEDRLHIRPVQVLRTERERVVIGDGLAPGDRVAVSALRAVVDGMRVRVAGPAGVDDPEPAAASGPDAPPGARS